MFSTPYAITLKVSEDSLLDFVAICNLFDDECWLSILNMSDYIHTYEPRNINSYANLNLNEELTLVIRGKCTDEQVEMLNEWRVK